MFVLSGAFPKLVACLTSVKQSLNSPSQPPTVQIPETSLFVCLLIESELKALVKYTSYALVNSVFNAL